MVYQLLIELEGVEPRIWRRVRVEADCTMRTLHHVIQLAMGWENCHLYKFKAGDEIITQIDFVDDDFVEDHEVYLDEYFTKVGQKMVYEYDFGDSWKHTVRLEEIIENDEELVPRCLGGERNCPPEDIGGIPGYHNIIEVMKNPRLPEYEEMVDWYGGVYDAERFRLDLVNEDFEEFDDYVEDTENDWGF